MYEAGEEIQVGEAKTNVVRVLGLHRQGPVQVDPPINDRRFFDFKETKSCRSPQSSQKSKPKRTP